MKSVAPYFGCFIPLVCGAAEGILGYQFLPNAAGAAFGVFLAFLPGSCFAIWMSKRMGVGDDDDDSFTRQSESTTK